MCGFEKLNIFAAGLHQAGVLNLLTEECNKEEGEAMDAHLALI